MEQATATQALLGEVRANAAAHALTLTDLLALERNAEVENVTKVMNGKLRAEEQAGRKGLMEERADAAVVRSTSVEVQPCPLGQSRASSYTIRACESGPGWGNPARAAVSPRPRNPLT